jgi:hypothetical protein
MECGGAMIIAWQKLTVEKRYEWHVYIIIADGIYGEHLY